MKKLIYLAISALFIFSSFNSKIENQLTDRKSLSSSCSAIAALDFTIYISLVQADASEGWVAIGSATNNKLYPGINYHIADIGCARPSVVRTATYQFDSNLWTLTIYPSGQVYGSFSGAYPIAVGKPVNIEVHYPL